MNQPEYSVEIRGLSKSFKTIKAVDDLDLAVKKGEIFGFLGPNGAGKTTTLKILAGLTRPDKGEIYLSGERAGFGGVAGRKSLGYLPDVPECYGYMTSHEFLKMTSQLFGYGKSETKRKIEEVLDLVGLQNNNKRIGTYSRGMKQRIGIAQALINEPETVLMDEPVSALDPEGRYEVIEILKRLKGKTTVFFSTHIISDIEKVCDSVGIIRNGKLLDNGTVNELKGKYDKKRIRFTIPNWTIPSNIAGFEEKIRNMPWCVSLNKESYEGYVLNTSNISLAQKELPGIFDSASIPMQTFDSISVSLEEIYLEVIRK